MTVVNQPRSFQFWNNITATPLDFNLDAGDYGLTATWTVGTAQLQRLIPDGTGANYIPVSAVLAAPGAASGYTTFLLPAGQYRVVLAGGVAGFIGLIEKINAGRAR